MMMMFSEVVNFCVVLSVLVLSTSAAVLSNEIQNDTPTKKCGTVRKANGSLHLKQEVSPGQLPFMVLLGYSFSNNENEIVYSCFGTLIHELYVLTAASCINANLVSVVVGEHKIGTDPDCLELADDEKTKTCLPKIQKIEVAQTIVHELFSLANYSSGYDIAMVKLKDSPKIFQPTSSINDILVCLPTSDVNNFQNLTVAGWGLTTNNVLKKIRNLRTFGAGTRTLSSFEVPVLKTETCRDSHSRFNPELQICTGGRGFCGSDGGSPSLLDMSGKHWVQVGIVSHGPNSCGFSSPPVVYTLVSHFLSWIQSVIEKF